MKIPDSALPSIRALRFDQGLPIKAIAAAYNVSYMCISYILHGRRKEGRRFERDTGSCWTPIPIITKRRQPH